MCRMQELVTEINLVLQLLRIERPPVHAADARYAREAGPTER
jgi:hypothetical protein